MHELSTEKLINIYEMAINNKVDKDFIVIIEDELCRRGVLVVTK